MSNISYNLKSYRRWLMILKQVLIVILIILEIVKRILDL